MSLTDQGADAPRSPTVPSPTLPESFEILARVLAIAAREPAVG